MVVRRVLQIVRRPALDCWSTKVASYRTDRILIQPKRIAMLLPNTKILILLRNPVSRAYSQRNVISVISLAGPIRNGGPQYPVPRLV